MPSRRRAQPRWSPLVWGALSLVSGCEADVEVSTVALELHAPPGCELRSPSRFELRALGDFRAQREPFELGGANAR